MLSKQQLREKILKSAPSHYPDYPYHNFDGHVSDAIECFTDIYNWLSSQGIPIDFDAGVIALALHDREYHLDSTQQGFDTKEELAAYLTVKDLKDLGADNELVKVICDGIIATTAKLEPATNLDKAIRYSDIGNVSAVFKVFLYGTYRLILEMQVRNLEIPDSFESYCKNSSKFLRTYFKKPIIFEHENIKVQYEPMTKYALENLNKIENLTIEKFLDEIKELAPKAIQNMPKNWLN